MTKQDDLFDLITTLSSNEKRQITLQSGITKPKGKNYFKLYQLYLSMDEYNPDFLFAEYQREYPKLSLKACKKRLLDHKTSLFEMILKVMRFSKSSQSAESTIHELLQDAHFLMDRKLYEKGFRYIEKAKRKAIEYGFSTYLIDIIKVQRTVLKEWGKKGYEKQVLALLDEQKGIRKEVEAEGQLGELADRLFLIIRKKARLQTESEKEEVRKLLSHPLLKKEAPKNFHAARNYHFSRAMGAQMFNQFHAAWVDYKAILGLFDSHPHQIRESPLLYQLAINNYLNACHLSVQYEDFPKYLKLLREHAGHSPDSKAESFQNYTFLALLYGMNKPDIPMALKLVPVIEEGLKVHADKINPSRILGFCSNITILAFVSGNLSLAREWNNKVLDYQNTELRKDAIYLSLLFHLILNAEQKLEGLYEDCQKVRSKLKPTSGDLADSLIGFLSKAAKSGGIDPKTNWGTLLEKLDRIEDKSGTAYQEVYIWVQCKITGRPMIEFI